MHETSAEDFTPVIRTDFSDDSAWESITDAMKQPDDELAEGLALMNEFYGEIGDEGLGDVQAMYQLINDESNSGLSSESVLKLESAQGDYAILLVVDEVTVSHADHPVLVIDLLGQRGRTFRSVPSQVYGIESNLSLANMDWEDFAHHVDHEGIFRGFEH